MVKWGVMCGDDIAFHFSSSSDEPLKWQFVDQFVSESGVGFNFFFMAFFFLFKSCITAADYLWTFLYFVLSFWSAPRRKIAALQAWRPLEAKKSRRRRFSSASWVPRVWASASPAAQPRNPVSTSVTSSQAPFLQKLDLRWFVQNDQNSSMKFCPLSTASVSSPKMQVGDQIVEVNGVDFTNVDHREVNFA